MKILLSIIVLSCAAAAQTTTGLAAGPIAIIINARGGLVYRAIGEIAGITVVIDPVVRDPDFEPRKIKVAAHGTVRELLDAAALQSKTAWRAVTPNIIFVYPKDACLRPRASTLRLLPCQVQ